RLQPADNLHRSSVILPDRYRYYMRGVVSSQRANLSSLAAENDGGDRDNKRLHRRSLEVNLRQRPGQQLALAIVYVDLNEEGAARGIDRIRSPHQRSLERLPGMLRKVNVDFGSALQIRRVQLRHIGIHAQRVQSLHVKELSCGARIDQLPDIDVA